MKTAEDVRSMVGELADRAPVVVQRRRRPLWQLGAMWFVAGMAITAAAGFFFDRQRGAARRQMAVDRTVATARDVGQWSEKKARHLRNRAQGTMAEMRTGELEDQAQGSSRY